MRAVRLVKTCRPLQIQEIPIPEIGLWDILVRVKAAGICHSDAHYRAGLSPVAPLPMTLGHEVSGIVEKVGLNVKSLRVGDRVCLHYMVTCGECEYCQLGSEQFCSSASMIGKYRDGGYAEYISIPARSAFKLPVDIPFDQGAIMMCSAATSYHALQKTRLKSSETIAIFGVGGLGMAAVQLALAMGTLDVFAVDINPAKLSLAEQYGAIPVNPQEVDPVDLIKKQTDGKGVDVALELIGLPVTMTQALQSLSIFGRAGLVGINEKTIPLDPYNQLIMREAEIIGVSDHLAQEIPTLIDYVLRGKLDLSRVIKDSIPLDADRINQVLDQMDSYQHQGRVVICP